MVRERILISLDHDTLNDLETIAKQNAFTKSQIVTLMIQAYLSNNTTKTNG